MKIRSCLYLPWLIGFIGGLTLSFSYAQGRVLRVMPHAQGNADGSTWADAMTLQAALVAANDNDTLWVTRGRYTPMHQTDGSRPFDPRNALFTIQDNLMLYGSFAGTESSLSQRTLRQENGKYPTVISGEIGLPFDRTDNVHRLFMIEPTGQGRQVTFNGFSFVHAFSRREHGVAIKGSAYVSLSIRNCTFNTNQCQALEGGGAALSLGTHARLIINQSLFENNQSLRKGGCVYLGTNSQAYISESKFIENTSLESSGGALFFSRDSRINLRSCEFRGNTALQVVSERLARGGAVFIDSSGTLTIVGCYFFENGRLNATNHGGAVFANARSTLHVIRSQFIGNAADAGGALHAQRDTRINILNSVFSANRAENGGAIVSREGAVMKVINCNLINNTLRTGLGAGIFIADTEEVHIANNLFFGNYVGRGENREIEHLWMANDVRYTLTHNLLEGGLEGITGLKRSRQPIATLEANSPADVFFSNLRLKPNSVAINAGNNDYLDGDPDAYQAGDEEDRTDASGGARLYNETVDLGAYEYAANSHSLSFARRMGRTLQARARQDTLSLRLVLGRGATGWRIAKVFNADFIRFESEGGDARTPIEIYCTENTGTERVAALRVSTTGPSGLSVSQRVFVKQRGATPLLFVDTFPENLRGLPNAGGEIRLRIRVEGNALDWQISSRPEREDEEGEGEDGEDDDENDSFLSFSQSQGSGHASVSIYYGENTSGEPRRERFIVSARIRGVERPQPLQRSFLVVQRTRNVNIRIRTHPINLGHLPPRGGEIKAILRLPDDSREWELASHSPFLSIRPTEGNDNDTVAIVYPGNTAEAMRPASVVFRERTEREGREDRVAEDTLQLMQATHTQHALEVWPPRTNLLTLPAEGGVARFRVKHGGEAEDWKATAAAASFLRLSVARGQSYDTLMLHYSENTGRTREAMLNIFTTPVSESSIRNSLIIRQLYGLTSLEAESIPRDMMNLRRRGGQAKIALSLLGNATGWRARSRSRFLRLSPTEGGATDTLVINYEENQGPERRGNVRITTTGAEEVADTVLLFRQQGVSRNQLLSVTEKVFKDLRIASPANTHLKIFNLSIACVLTLHDLTGKPVLQQNLLAGTHSIPLAGITRGIYIITLRGGKYSYTQRLLKE